MAHPVRGVVNTAHVVIALLQVIVVLATLLMLLLLAAYLRLERTWQLVVAVNVGV